MKESSKYQRDKRLVQNYMAQSQRDGSRHGFDVMPTREFYSSCPELAGTVNLVRLTATGETLVSRKPVRWR